VGIVVALANPHDVITRERPNGGQASGHRAGSVYPVSGEETACAHGEHFVGDEYPAIWDTPCARRDRYSGQWVMAPGAQGAVGERPAYG
jgi:hypothetical protein